MSLRTPAKNKSGMEADLLKREKIIPVKIALLFSLAYLASSLCLPFLLSGIENASYIASWATCVLCVPVLYLSAKKLSHAVWLTILWFFLSAFVGSPVLPAIIFGTVVAISAASSLISASGNYGPVFLAVATLLSFVLTALVTRDYLVSLFSLAILIPAIILAFATKKKVWMTTTIAFSGFGLVVALIAVIIYRMHVLYDNIGLEGLLLAADSFVDAFVYYTEYALTEVQGTEITPAIRQELIYVAESYVNLAPGILVALSLILVYFAHGMQINLLRSYGVDEYLTPEATLLTVSVPAAIVFMISYLLSFATSAAGGVSIIAVIGNNLCLMLMPCLILKGFAALKALPLKLGFWGILIAGGLILFFIFSPSLPSLLALLGAFFVLVVSIDRWAKDHYGKGEQK